MRSGRFFAPPAIIPGLFDYSGAFLGDLMDRLKSLPSAKELQGSADADAADNMCGNKDNSDGRNVSASTVNNDRIGQSSSSSSSSRGTRHLHPETTQGDDGDSILSDGEVVGTSSSSKKSADLRSKKREKESRDVEPERKTISEKKSITKISRYDASKYYIEVFSVIEGGNESLVGQTCACLMSATDRSSEEQIPNNNIKDHSGTGTGTGIGTGASINDDITIGRSRGSDFSLDDLSISKKHAVLSYFTNVGFILRDLGSKHGTTVDGKRIGVRDDGSKSGSEKVSKSVSKSGNKSTTASRTNNGLLLTDGMIIQFGRVACRFYKKRQSAVLSSG